MPKIKWVGIIKEVSAFQKGELPPNAKKLNMPATIGEMMAKAIPFLIAPTLVIIVSMFLKTYLNRKIVISFPFFILGLGAGFLLLLIHEYLHAIVYPKRAVVSIGILPKHFAAVALSSYPLSRIRFTVMSLLPSLLGIIPIVLFWIMPPAYTALNGFLFGTAILGLVSPYPDFYNVFQIYKQTPPRCQIQFYEDDTYYIAADKPCVPEQKAERP